MSTLFKKARMLKTVFVDFSNNFNDKHAIYSLSAYLRSKGIDTKYIKEADFNKAIKKIRQLKPDLLLYSAFSVEVNNFIKFDELLKKEINVKSVIGGPGPTYDWSILERSTIDACCVGEGEYALTEFIQSGFKSVKNIIIRENKEPVGYFPLTDLDSLPMPERNSVYSADNLLSLISSKQFLSGRGCPYRCTYCHNNAFNQMFKTCGNIVRKKSVSYLIDEIDVIKKRYSLKTVIFQDDTFIIDKKWLLEFCQRYPKEINLPFTCSIRANLMDEEIARVLKESGCIQAWWSIESGNSSIRNQVLKRNMNREQIIETGRLLNKFKIPSRITNMIGLPGEKFENMLETVELNIAVKPSIAVGNMYVPYPSLELTEYAVKNNFLAREAVSSPSGFFRQSVLNFTPQEKIKMQKLLFLFPVLVKYPVLYRIQYLRRILLIFPRFVLGVTYYIIFLCHMAKLYKFQQSLKDSFLMVKRFLKDI